MSPQPAGNPDEAGISPAKQPLWKRWTSEWPARTATRFILLPLIGALISVMVIGRIVDYFVGPKSYVVVVVGDATDRATNDMLEAAKQSSIAETLGDVRIDIDTRSDLADPAKAELLAKELAGRSNVLMVVGHGSSSASQRALPVYLAADPPVPVILTTDTNPGLLAPQARTDDSVPPVFRVFPTDDNQASVGAAFVSARKAKAVWLIEDTTNPTYSHYLARTFLKEVYESHPEVKVVLWSTNLNLPPYAVDKLGIDWVFFAGAWPNALILVRQLKALPGGQKPAVLLSDSSADKSLTKFGAADIEGVFVLHPLPADVFNNDEYRVVGKQSVALASALVSLTHDEFESLAAEGAPVGYYVRRLLGLRRVADARRALSRAMTKAVRNELPLTASGWKIQMERDRKTRAVVRKDASFHVWQAQNQQFVPVQ